jgi:hypothetical protein
MLLEPAEIEAVLAEALPTAGEAMEMALLDSSELPLLASESELLAAEEAAEAAAEAEEDVLEPVQPPLLPLSSECPNRI